MSDREFDYIPPSRGKADFTKKIDAFLDEELNEGSRTQFRTRKYHVDAY